MRIFDMDGPLYKIGTELADVMILTLYWVICCIPIITIGASTSSLFYVYGKKVRGEDVYVTRDYFKSFRENFKQSIPITVFLLVLWISAYMYFIIILGYGGQAPTMLNAVALFFMAEISVISIYVLALLSRFHMKVSNIFMTAFVLAHRHLLTSLGLIAVMVGVIIASLSIPMVMFVLPALTVGLHSFLVQRIFAKQIEAAKAHEAQSSDVEDNENIEAVIEEVETVFVEADEVKAESIKEDVKVEEEDKEFLKYI